MRTRCGSALFIPNSGRCPPSGHHPQGLISLYPYIQQFTTFYQHFFLSKVGTHFLNPFIIWGLMQGPRMWWDELTCLKLRENFKLLIFFLFLRKMHLYHTRLSYAKVRVFSWACLDAEWRNKSSYSLFLLIPHMI